MGLKYHSVSFPVLHVKCINSFKSKPVPTKSPTILLIEINGPNEVTEKMSVNNRIQERNAESRNKSLQRTQLTHTTLASVSCTTPGTTEALTFAPIQRQ